MIIPVNMMNKLVPVILLLLVQFQSGSSQSNISYPVGDIHGPFLWKSKIYPGTERNYWLYIPKQYDASKPACTMVVQDGLSRATGWKLPSALDSLIALREIPVIIGIFIDHGKVPSAGTDTYPRFNRSLEYDGMGDTYARFLIEEIYPEVSKTYNLSPNPNDRSIAGASSGAICAFNAAWERPDQFRRVLSTIGTYVGLRGGDEFSTLVRKTEPKPLRVFLADGTNDLNIYAGDWWMANQTMERALTWAGYEVNHAWGDGAHDSKQAVTIMADALKWLWKDYPQPVQTHKSNARLNLVVAGETWKEAPLANMKVNRMAVNKSGQLFFTDKQFIYKMDENGKALLFSRLNGEVGGISFHGDGRLFAADLTRKKIVAIEENGNMKEVVSNVLADFLTLSDKGIYFSETESDRIGFFSLAKKAVSYVNAPGHPTGLAISAEQTFLNVGITNSTFGFSFRIADDGLLEYGQEYVHYHIPYGQLVPGTTGMAVDADNLLYSATSLGVQLSDQLGRVNFIFSKPAEGAQDVKLGGKEFNILYVNCNGRLFSRKINAKGILSFLPAVKPPKPGL
jgi:enterochelin esterase-like enzyme/sugar lactone lactonase YvrE